MFDIKMKNNYGGMFFLLFSYLILIIYPFVFLVLSPLIVFHDKRKYIPIVFIYILLLSIFYSSTVPILDLLNYQETYLNINEIGMFSSSYGLGIEFIIILLMKAFRFVGLDYQQFLICFYMMIFGGLYYIISRVAGVWSFFIFSVTTLNICFFQSNSLFLRQMLSVVFILLFVTAAPSKYRIGWLVVSFFTHISAAVNIALIYFYNIFKKNKRNVLLISIIMIILLISIFLVFKNTSLYSYVLMKLNFEYLSEKYKAINIFYIILPIFYITVSVTLVYIYKIKVNNRMLLFLFLSNAVLLLLTKDIPSVPNRLALLIFSFSPISLFVINSTNRMSFLTKYIIMFLLYVITILIYSYSQINIEYHNNNWSYLNNGPLSSTIIEYIKVLI